MITIVFILVIIAVVAIFSVQNASPVAVSFLLWNFQASLAIVIFLSVLIGGITGAIVFSLLRKKVSTKKGNQGV